MYSKLLHCSRCRDAFTLVELLTVVVVMAIMAAILLPVISRVRKSADASVCTSRMRQIGIGIALYITENKGVLPGPYAANNEAVRGWYSSGTAAERSTLAGLLQPYIAAPDPRLDRTYPDVFQCPSVVKNSNANGTYSHEGAIISKVLNVAVADPATGVAYNPFSVEGRPMHYNQLEMASPARVFAIRECSGRDTNHKPAPLEPAHGQVYNAVFFDWHVGRLNASTLDSL